MDKCANCKFFDLVSVGDTEHQDDSKGECRRNAPMSAQFTQRQILTVLLDLAWRAYGDSATDNTKDINAEGPEVNWAEWPVVFGSDWCGGFQRKHDAA